MADARFVLPALQEALREERRELAARPEGAGMWVGDRAFYAAMAQMLVDRPLRLSVTPEVALYMQVAYLSFHATVGDVQAARRLRLFSANGRVTLLRHVEAGADGKAQAFVNDAQKVLVIGCAPRGTGFWDVFRAQ